MVLTTMPPNTRMQHDRFAREILAISARSGAALAAADAQSVGRGPSMPSSFQRPIRPTPAMFATA